MASTASAGFIFLWYESGGAPAANPPKFLPMLGVGLLSLVLFMGVFLG